MNDGKPVNGKTPDSRIDQGDCGRQSGNRAEFPGAAARSGTSDHGEYYTEEGKIILTAGVLT